MRTPLEAFLPVAAVEAHFWSRWPRPFTIPCHFTMVLLPTGNLNAVKGGAFARSGGLPASRTGLTGTALSLLHR